MDDRSPEKRSATMRAVKSTDTKIEQDFIELLRSRRVFDVETHVADITGKPDLIHRESKVAIFIDGCFWHGCPHHLRIPETNIDYWRRKILGNRCRDRKNNKILTDSGWVVIRIWEHSFKSPRRIKWWATRVENQIKNPVLVRRSEALCS